MCAGSGAVVTLGDVAEIALADARPDGRHWRRSNYSPSCPAVGEEKIVRVREIQDLLMLRGVNLTEHQFSGSSEVSIRTASARQQLPAAKPISTASMRRFVRRCRAVRGDREVSWTNNLLPASRIGPSSSNCRTPSPSGSPIRSHSIQGAGKAAARGPGRNVSSWPLRISAGHARTTLAASDRVIAPVVVAVHSLAAGRDHPRRRRRAAAACRRGRQGCPALVHAATSRRGDRARTGSGRWDAGTRPSRSDSLRATPSVRASRRSGHRGRARAGGDPHLARTPASSRGWRYPSANWSPSNSLARIAAAYYARYVSGTREVEVYARPPQVANER